MPPSARARHLITTAALGLVIVACTAQGGSGASGTTGSGSASASASTRPGPSFSARPTVLSSEAPVTGEVPAAVMDAVRADLTARTGTDASAATVKQAEAVEWSDGSLGCPQPGVMYTQSIVPGYQVVLTLDGKDYDYRVGGEGQVIRLCEGKLPSAG